MTKISYELAKELKEAGFPQDFSPPFDFYYPEKEDNVEDTYLGVNESKKELNVQHCSGQEVDGGCYGLGVYEGKIEDWNLEHKYDEKPVKILVKVPSLSEMIEACGEGVMLKNECGKWEAMQGCTNRMVRMGESGAKHEVEGSNPEDAVTRLWLALNKK